MIRDSRWSDNLLSKNSTIMASIPTLVCQENGHLQIDSSLNEKEIALRSMKTGTQEISLMHMSRISQQLAWAHIAVQGDSAVFVWQTQTSDTASIVWCSWLIVVQWLQKGEPACDR